MAPRSSWKGFIQLSLVSVPVKAYTATASGSDIRLNQLHRECHNRVQYQKVCPEHGPLPSDEIVSGYEYDKGQYVVIDSEEIAAVRRQSDRALRLEGFVAAEEIDPIHFSGRTMYLLPDGPVGQKPYALFRHAMEDDDLVALARMVVSGREQLVLLRPVGRLLAACVLTYPQKIKDPAGFEDELDEAEIGPEEQKLTRTLVEASLIQDLDLSSYRDPYTEQMTGLIETKIAGKEIVSVPDPEEPKVIHLMEALKQSIANVQDTAAPRKKAKRKSATSAKAAKTAKTTKTAKSGKKKTSKKTSAKMAPSARTTAKKQRKSG